MVDSIITIILKRLLKKPVRRYMFWLELRLTCKKKTLLMNAFFKSRFSYWLLVWMSHGRLMNNKTSRLQEWWLRVIYNDKTLSFADLLAKHWSVTTHTQNLQVLATEMFKLHKKMLTELMQGPFLCKIESLQLGKSPWFCNPKYKFYLPWLWKHIKSRT